MLELKIPAGYILPHEAAKRLGLTEGRIRALLRESRLDYVSTPWGWRLVSEESLESYAREREARLREKAARNAAA